MRRTAATEDAARALIVVTSSSVGDVVMPGAGQLHLCQAWRALTCWCGDRHASSDDSDLTIFIGPARPELAACPEAIVVAVLPFGDGTPLRYPRVIATRAQRFDRFATEALHNLADGLFRAGLIGYGASDARKLLDGAALFELAYASGRGSLVEVAQPVIARVTELASKRLHVGLRINDQTTLFEIDDLAGRLLRAADSHASCLFHATPSAQGGVEISALMCSAAQ